MKIQMKTIFYTLSSAFALVVLGGCGKYGYNFEDGYSSSGADSSSISSDTSDTSPDYSMYAQAAIYPGLVDDTVTRLQRYPVTLDLSYLKNPDQLRISTNPSAWLSTGMYAPTGESITVDIPEGVYGLTAQIGCWTDNLTSKDVQNRYPILYTVKQLFPGRNYIRSPFGGPIYITESFSQDKIIDVYFTGAVKMCDFILGETDVTQWQSEIKKSGVPWFELRAPHIIFTLPTEKAQEYAVATPDLLMQTWEDIFNHDYSEWEGLSDNATNELDQSIGLPWRVVADIQPSLGYAHSGFPVVFKDDAHWFKDFITNYQTLISNGSWGIEHEVGHNNQQSNWKLSNMGETTNNMHTYKTGHRLGFMPTNAGTLTSSGLLDWVKTTDTATKNLLTDSKITVSTYAIPMTGFFLQMFEKPPYKGEPADTANGYGYGLYTQFYKQTRRASHVSNNDQDRIDFMYIESSRYFLTDMYVFFKFWGLTPSKQAKTEVAAIDGVEPLNYKLWTFDPKARTGGEHF